jgi:hypothetical protein
MNPQLETIDLAQLDGIAGGYNPFSSAWNTVKGVAHQGIDLLTNTAGKGIHFVRNHSGYLLQ